MSENKNSYKIQSKIFIQGTITTKTGLHIGGSSVGLSIGGADAIVVRNPIDNKPYIPGSSLRGKMRSLLERMRGDETLNDEGGFSINDKEFHVLAGTKGNTLLGKLFGTASDTGDKENKSPTRLIVRDAILTEDSYEKLLKAPNTDMPLTEVKTEVAIDRITSAANPRQIERVPEGSKFQFEFILTLLENDDMNEFFRLINEAMALVQDDYIGGHGSRGYGRVVFHVTDVYQRTADYYKKLPDEPQESLNNCIFFKTFKAS
ncbi:CRISPR-associated RAMP Csm3 [Candidatus Magnetomorum sp. HK-1]|nr:CRISPR-associated RAMP Csm3 [Candidatus Magnetomorum sp. HK-1]